VNRPPKLSKLLFNVCERKGKRRPPVRTRGPLGQNTFPLQLESLPLAFFFCRFCLIVRSDRFWGSSLILLFFHGFTLPSSRHSFHSTLVEINK
jgi:hypothetical protein